MSILYKFSISAISIHAPARGATSIAITTKRYTMISIHAPARGATVLGKGHCIVHVLFQSTLPRGERLASKLARLERSVFQSTLPRGERLFSTHQLSQRVTFQSTLPRGERPADTVSQCLVTNFNPRSREGSDCKNTQTTNIISVYFYLYYIIFVSLATNTAYITITKPSKCRCESPYTFC